MRKASFVGLLALALVAILGGLFATRAGALGPWAETPAVSCSTVTIDPDNWVHVRFLGDFGTGHLDRTVSYGAADPHNATLDVSDLTGKPGDYHYAIVAVSNFGYGDVISRTATGVLHCGQEEPSSTTSSTEAPATTVPATVTTAGPPSSTPPSTSEIGTPASLMATSTTVGAAPVAVAAFGPGPDTMPRTGSLASRLAPWGFAFLAVGGALALLRRRHTRA
jgi:hypothetical protein